MSKTEDDPLGPAFTWRLRSALDRVVPPHTPPRYLSASAGFRSWRMAPVAIALGATCLLAVTAVAATGSASPVVWTRYAASTISGIGHHSDASPSPESEPTPSGAQAPGAAKETPESEHGEPSPTPSKDSSHEPSSSPEPHESPEPSTGPEPSASPSSSGDSSEPSPTPTSSSGDH